MVLSGTKFKGFLDNKEYTEASKYANQQLSEDAILSAPKCIKTLAYYLFNLKPSSEKETHKKDICDLVDIFKNSLESLTSLSNAVDMVDFKVVDEILISTHHVSRKVSAACLKINHYPWFKETKK